MAKRLCYELGILQRPLLSFPFVFSHNYAFVFSPRYLCVMLPLTYPFPYFIPQSSNPVQRHSSLSLGGTDSEDEQVNSRSFCY